MTPEAKGKIVLLGCGANALHYDAKPGTFNAPGPFFWTLLQSGTEFGYPRKAALICI